MAKNFVTPVGRISFPRQELVKQPEWPGDGKPHHITHCIRDVQLSDAIRYQRQAAGASTDARNFLRVTVHERDIETRELYSARARNFQREARYWSQRARDMVRLANGEEM